MAGHDIITFLIPQYSLPRNLLHFLVQLPLKSVHRNRLLCLPQSDVTNTKVKQSHYRPGEAVRVPGVCGSQISRQSAHEGGKVVSPTHRPPLPVRKYSWYSFLLEAESNPRTIVRPEGLCQWKFSNDTIGNRTSNIPTCSAVPHTTYNQIIILKEA